MSERFQYQAIAKELRDRILRGDVPAGGRLEPERELSGRYGVHRHTVRQALATLEQEGLISTELRKGTVVLPLGRRLDGSIFLVNLEVSSGPNGSALFESIVRVAEQAGARIARLSTEPLPGSSLNRIPSPSEIRDDAAGIVLWHHPPTDTERIRVLNEAVPVVLVDHRVSGVSVDCVRFDDVTGGRMVTSHLIGLGHRQIAFLTDEVFADSVQSRWHGYVLAHEDANLTRDGRLSILFQEMDPDLLTCTMRHLIENPETRPTAVVCSNDLVAFSLLRFLNAEGLRVPDDMAVTGYGNSMPEYGSAISLTTVDQPFDRAGLEAGRLLVERTHQTRHERLASPRDICLPVSLVLRRST
ncbi:MAG: GntR family transcriptional regulator [Fimbriimonas sp.]|nr:GntR family transcriptional regulator [Fimbriimonas sp.]